MLKNFSKLLFLLLTILIITSFSTCYATEAVKTSETDKTTNTVVTTGTSDTEGTTAKDNNYYGDLYIFDNEVVIDKVIYGNVYIIGNQVEITGQIEGNLFVLAMDLKLDKSYIGGSIYACANNIYYNAASTYLYATANNIEMTYDSYVVRDAKLSTNTSDIKAAIGRDLDLISSNINLGEGENIPIIYGNLRYTSPSEITIPEGVITENGTVTYTQNETKSENSKSNPVLNVLISFFICIITAIIIYLLIIIFAPEFNIKLENEQISFIKLLKYFGIGLLSFIVFTVLFMVLLLTYVGIKLAFILLLFFVLLCIISVPVFSIVLTNTLKPILKLEKKLMYYLVLSLVSIILYGLTLIPVVGIIISLILNPIEIGMLIYIIMPHKVLTDEEKAIKEEAKKQAREDKEKRKQAKLEAKETKKNNSTDL